MLYWPAGGHWKLCEGEQFLKDVEGTRGRMFVGFLLSSRGVWLAFVFVEGEYPLRQM